MALAVGVALWTLSQLRHLGSVAPSANSLPSREMSFVLLDPRLKSPQETPLLPGHNLGMSLGATLNYTTYLPLMMWDDYRPYHILLPVFALDYSSLRPDLVITRVAFESSDIVAGESFIFSVVVHNQGAEDTAHGAAPAWFTVEVYIKSRRFTPAGPPVGPLDHAVGFCSNDSLNCITGTQLPARLAFVDGLESRESREVIFRLAFPKIDVYDLYVQVDTTWSNDVFTGRWWGQHREENERNNIFSVEDIFVPAGQ